MKITRKTFLKSSGIAALVVALNPKKLLESLTEETPIKETVYDWKEYGTRIMYNRVGNLDFLHAGREITITNQGNTSVYVSGIHLAPRGGISFGGNETSYRNFVAEARRIT